MDLFWKKVRKTDSMFVHSPGVHAYFSVIWVFVFPVLLCGLVKAVILDFLSFQKLKSSSNTILETQGGGNTTTKINDRRGLRREW